MSKNMIAAILTSVMGLSLAQTAEAGWRDVRSCLGEHVSEAMDLNKQRKTAYMKLSQGRSKDVSNALLWMEWKISLAAPLADAWSAYFQAKGIPIMCDDFVPISDTPAFQAQNPQGKDSLNNFRQPDVAKIKEKLLEFHKARAYMQMAEYADAEIIELDRVPRYNCMVKHMLESVRRMAALTPVHAQKAQEQGIRSTEPLSRTVLKSHIMFLNESAKIDELAAPLQAEGLMIVCQDVPYIPWPK